MKALTVARTAARIGLFNCARVALYRLKLRLGWFRRAMPVGEPIEGLFLTAIEPDEQPSNAEFAMFGWRPTPLNPTPDWHTSPFWPDSRADDRRHWSVIPDFGASSEDIKAVWELSRFDWAPQLALAASAGDRGRMVLLETLVRDWSTRNPFSQGANWKCAQEASLRLLNLLFAAELLGLEPQSASSALRRFVAEHIRRILPTTSYAIGQQNNHATSEAAALTVAGMWLEATQDAALRALASKAQRAGLRLFDKAVRTLVMDDGCFAQYSTNYHRLFLATAVVLDGFRRRFGKPDFGTATQQRLARATEWLSDLTEQRTGLAPLLGASDGANVLNAAAADYRDMRPVVSATRWAFLGDVTGEPPLLLKPFPVLKARPSPSPGSNVEKPALITLRNARIRCVVRLPTYRFRPSQADCLHLDIWIDGLPFLIDAGTVTYADPQKNALLSGIASHNTVAFDNREPMPRLGRFLFGDWISRSTLRHDDRSVTASYVDRFGARHTRHVTLLDDRIEVRDDIEGYDDIAMLSWRLAEAAKAIGPSAVESAEHRISVQADASFDVSLTQRPHGDHYLRETSATVLVATGKDVRRFVTTIEPSPAT